MHTSHSQLKLLDSQLGEKQVAYRDVARGDSCPIDATHLEGKNNKRVRSFAMIFVNSSN